ncbi:MFS family multidrug transport protein [Vibrio astriarenae]|nr:MFS family multidrug transport protein [Vibrio sp. C7]
MENPSLNFVLFMVLGAIGALTPLAIDMYLPAMPDIARDLNVTPGEVQITLTMYTAGFAIGQLIHGPISDSYGRRPVLIGGTLFFMLAAIISATVSDIDSLTYVRAAQGFAGAAAAVIIQAVVRDMFEREDFARAMSFVTLVITIAPLIAPMIGATLRYGLAGEGYSGLSGVLNASDRVSHVRIPETLPVENRSPLRMGTTLRNYFKLLLNPVAIGLMFCGAFSFSGMFAS